MSWKKKLSRRKKREKKAKGGKKTERMKIENELVQSGE